MRLIASQPIKKSTIPTKIYVTNSVLQTTQIPLITIFLINAGLFP